MDIESYEGLKGTQFKDHFRGKEYELFLAEIDYSVGLTAKYLNPENALGNKEGNCICLIAGWPTCKEYNRMFNEVVKGIKKGETDSNKIFGDDTGTVVCAFGG